MCSVIGIVIDLDLTFNFAIVTLTFGIFVGFIVEAVIISCHLNYCGGLRQRLDPGIEFSLLLIYLLLHIFRVMLE